MLKPTLVAGLALAMVGCGAAQQGGTGGPAEVPTASSPSKGPTAPDFTLPTLDGSSASLSDYAGKVVLIDFWSTTCDPCLQEMPELVKLYKEKKAQGFEVLAITIDGPETMSQVSGIVKDKGMIFPILLDEETEVMDRYNPKGELPFTLVVDRKGSITLRRAGYQAGDEASMKTLVTAIEQALAQQ